MFFLNTPHPPASSSLCLLAANFLLLIDLFTLKLIKWFAPKPSVSEPKANKGLKTENTVSQQMFRSVLG